MPANLQPLRYPRFRLFWTAGAVSDIGTWLQLATIGTLLATSGASITATALVYGATFVPQALCSPLGGVLADRVDRRRMFLAALGVQAVCTALLAAVIAAGERRPEVLGALILVQSGAGSLGGPSLQAMLPELVPREHLTAAVALNLTSWNTGRVTGPLLAWLLSPIGAKGCVALNAVSFAVLWVAIARMGGTFRAPARTLAPIRTELADGARHLVRLPSVVLIVVALGLSHFFFVPFMGTVPVKARALVGGDAVAAAAARRLVQRTTGMLMASQGLGAIAGSLLVAPLLRRARTSSVALIGVVGALVACCGYAYSGRLLPAMACMACTGCGVALHMSVYGGVVQRDAPTAHRGRVLSWYSGSMGITYGIGLMGIGRLADSVGIARALLAGSLTMLAVVLVGVTFVGTWRERLDHGTATGAAPASELVEPAVVA